MYNPKVLGVHTLDTISGFLEYRLVLPFLTMKRNGLPVDWAPASQLTLSKINEYDIIFTPRILKADGIKPRQVIDLDDDLIWGETEIQSLASVDGITVSTDYLKDKVKQYVSTPTRVCRNSIDINMFPLVREEREETTIALMGSQTHERDWRILTNVIPEILSKYKDVLFFIIGYVPDYLESIPQKFGNQVIAIPAFIDYNSYIKLLSNIDVRLSPVNPRFEFNHSKSGIAAIEIAAAHGLSICQDMQIYRDVVTNMYNGILCDYTEESWHDAICLALDNRELRLSLSNQARKDIEQKHNINENWKTWYNFFKQIPRRRN